MREVKLPCYPYKISQIVAILTDFGLKDHYVGVVKGRILQEVRGTIPHFIDLSHEIPPQDIKKGALCLKFSHAYFPEGTIFLAVVDPGVGTTRRALLIHDHTYFYIGPDNGIFTFILKKPQVKTYEIVCQKVFKPPYSLTFHARDLFAIAVAKLLNQEPIENWATPISKEDLTLLYFPEPAPTKEGLEVSIWTIDHFGNLITNLSQDMIKEPFEVWVNNQRIRVVKTYAEGKERELIALFGSEGLLEIAIKNDSAYEKLGLPQIIIKFKSSQKR